MALRLKMKLWTTLQSAADGKNVSYNLAAVVGDENKPWSKFTPTGTLHFTVTNPDAEELKLGGEYFVTIEGA